MLIWARDRGCPWSDEVYENFITYKDRSYEYVYLFAWITT